MSTLKCQISLKELLTTSYIHGPSAKVTIVKRIDALHVKQDCQLPLSPDSHRCPRIALRALQAICIESSK